MKIWCTKWLFTTGIMELEAIDCGNGMVKVILTDKTYFPYCLHGEGREWHKTRESAVAKADEMRIKKLMALDKQMKKIAAMKFE